MLVSELRVHHRLPFQVAGASDAASSAVCQRVMPDILVAAQSQEAATERLVLRVLALRAAHSIVQSVLQSNTQQGTSAAALQVCTYKALSVSCVLTASDADCLWRHIALSPLMEVTVTVGFHHVCRHMRWGCCAVLPLLLRSPAESWQASALSPLPGSLLQTCSRQATIGNLQ